MPCKKQLLRDCRMHWPFYCCFRVCVCVWCANYKVFVIDSWVSNLLFITNQLFSDVCDSCSNAVYDPIQARIIATPMIINAIKFICGDLWQCALLPPIPHIHTYLSTHKCTHTVHIRLVQMQYTTKNSISYHSVYNCAGAHDLDFISRSSCLYNSTNR